MKQNLIILFCIISIKVTAQSSSDYYYEIPTAPDSYTAGTVASRLVDGLGYRYYWATATLTDQDLSYRPNENARSTEETIDHIWGLSVIIRNAAQADSTDFSAFDLPEGYRSKRDATLENFKIASEILKVSSNKDLESFDLVFIQSDETKKYPFWNGINGPIADAVWHAGQLASFRRSSGNPINPKASMLTGQIMD